MCEAATVNDAVDLQSEMGLELLARPWCFYSEVHATFKIFLACENLTGSFPQHACLESNQCDSTRHCWNRRHKRVDMARVRHAVI